MRAEKLRHVEDDAKIRESMMMTGRWAVTGRLEECKEGEREGASPAKCLLIREWEEEMN